MAERSQVVEMALPELEEGVTEAFVVSWYKAVGEEVAADEPLVEVMTDKANVDLDAPASGILRERRFDEEARVRVGEILAVIERTNG